MKKLLAFFLALLLAVAASASNLTVTTVSSVASTVVTPGSPTVITIQNTGAGDVVLGFDGGTTNRQKSTPDPTPTSGYLLTAGSSVTLSCPANVALPQIRAVLRTATTTTLQIATNDPFSS